MLCGFIFTLYIFYLIMEVRKLFFKKCYYRKNIRETWSWKSKEKAWTPWPMKLLTSWGPRMLLILPVRSVSLLHVNLPKKVTVIIRTQIVLLLSNLLVNNWPMYIVSFLNICLVNPSNKRIKDPLLGLLPSAWVSSHRRHSEQRAEIGEPNSCLEMV